MGVYYNEHDKNAAQWLRNLMAAGLIPQGHVDERSILEVTPDELKAYDQCHFFAGIGVWPLALRGAGVPATKKLWTGSCPCQPFSGAGKRNGVADERHLWPAFHWLIDQCRPPIVLGEQVASQDGLGWLDIVSTDLEGSGYSFAASDLCAAGVTIPFEQSQAGEWLRRTIHDNPSLGSLRDFADWAASNLGEGGSHIRQRLYFVGVGDTASRGSQHEPSDGPVLLLDQPLEDAQPWPESGGLCASAGGLADSDDAGREGRLQGRSDPEREAVDGHAGRDGADHSAGAGNIRGIRSDWLFCQDDRWRPIEPGLEPLAHGVAGRVGQLRAYGNALEAHTATRFVEAVMEIVA